MFNITEELDHFRPIDVSSLEQKLGSIPDDMKGAIELYNKALEDISSHNEDMAIIALRKAISIYPAFYEAMNLMGVCYDSLGDEENARRMFEKVIQLEDSSIRATDYINRLDGIVSREDGKKPKPRNRNKLQAVSWVAGGLAPEKASPYYLKYVLGFLACFVLMCILWLIMPLGKPLVVFPQKVDNSAQMQDLIEENALLSQRLNDATKALETANQKELQLRDEIDQYQKWSRTLRDLQAMAQDEKYRDVVIEIEKNLAGLDIPQDIEAEIIALNNACKPKALAQIYTSAKKLYDNNAKNKSMDVFKQSASEFTLAIEILEQLETKPKNAAEIYYHAGKSLAQAEYPNKEEAYAEAKRCFNMTKTLSPNTNLATYAQARINEIDNGKTVRY